MQKKVFVRRASERVLSVGLSVAVALALLPAPPAMAQTTEVTPAQPAKKVTKTSKVRKTKLVEPEPRLPGGETRAERERRLLRECKGRPNAGACSGYAS